MKRTRTTLAAVASAITVLLAGCGGGSPTATGEADVDEHAVEVYGQINVLSGAERTKTLVKMAEEEGTLSLYTSNTDIDDIVDAFSDKYDIEVEVYRGNSESVLQRVLQESKAGYRGVDLIETNAGELNILAGEGHFYDYKGKLRDAVRPEGQADGWTADRFNVFVVGWNTKLVDPGQVPDSLEDFTDPSWKGKVSMEVGDVDWFAAMWQYYLGQGMSEDEVRELFGELAANSKVVKGHTVQGELLSAGQFGAAVSIYSHTVDKAEDAGAPLQWLRDGTQPVEPVVLRPNGAGLMSNAKHPAAAMLFMDFLLTEGQSIVQKSYRIGSVPTKDDPLKGIETISVPEEELLSDGAKWNALYEDVVEGGTPTE